MPLCRFYADRTDHRAILEFIFETKLCDVYEMYSEIGEKIRSFNSLSEIETALGIKDWGEPLPEIPYLVLHVKGSGKPKFRRIKVDYPKQRLKGIRYETTGWGLIQLHLKITHKGKLHPSYTNHNSKKRAILWEPVSIFLGKSSRWDFEEITSYSNKLIRFIKKLSQTKLHGQSVLPAAEGLRHVDIEFPIV